MIALLALCLATSAHAQDDVALDVGGDVKGFFVASFPYDHVIMPPDPTATGAVDFRLKLRFEGGPITILAHEAITAVTPGTQGVSGIGTGVGNTAPEAMPLTWVVPDSPTLRVQGRMDRLSIKLSVPGFDLTMGRQPISFGHGMFFTPLDLVNPFFPTTIDQEYKPGVDAIRMDGYVGMSRVTAVIAYAGDWNWSGMVAAAYGQTTIGVTDIGLFYGYIRRDHVIGATMVTGVGPVELHSDATVTVPDPDLDAAVFFRGTFGALWRPFEKSTVSGELYVQTNGATDPGDYLTKQLDPRWTRGELWLTGRTYLGLTWGQEVVPTMSANVALITNLEDPSAFLAPGFTWSVGPNATVGFGAYFGLGPAPGPMELTDLIGADGVPLSQTELLGVIDVKSEFGLYPHSAFVQIKTYF